MTPRSILVVALRPWLWRVALRLAAPGWWRRPPFLPRPDPEYLAFRLQTMYGTAEVEPDRDDLLVYLRWCRRFDEAAR